MSESVLTNEIEDSNIKKEFSPEQNNQNLKEFYILLGTINFSSMKYIEEGKDETDSAARVAKVLDVLRNFAREIGQISGESANLNGKCPNGTVWDPFTKTCI